MNAPLFITLPDPRCIDFFVPKPNAKRRRFDLDARQKKFVKKQEENAEGAVKESSMKTTMKDDREPKTCVVQDEGNFLLLNVLHARQLRGLEPRSHETDVLQKRKRDHCGEVVPTNGQT